MYLRTSICMYKVPNRTYVRSREHTVLVFVHRRCPVESRTSRRMSRTLRARSSWSRSRGTRDVEDGARAQLGRVKNWRQCSRRSARDDQRQWWDDTSRHFSDTRAMWRDDRFAAIRAWWAPGVQQRSRSAEGWGSKPEKDAGSYCSPLHDAARSCTWCCSEPCMSRTQTNKSRNQYHTKNCRSQKKKKKKASIHGNPLSQKQKQLFQRERERSAREPERECSWDHESRDDKPSLYLEEVTNVDDEAVGAGLHRDPFAINLHLEAGDAVLVKDRQQMGVGVSSQTDGKRRLRARRVEVEAHGDHPLLLQVLVEMARF